MRFGSFLFLLLPVTCLLSCTGISHAQEIEKNCENVSALTALLQKYHYAPISLSGNMGKITGNFFYHLDPAGIYFKEPDVANVQRTLTGSSDFSDDNVCKFIDAVTRLYKTGLGHADTVVSRIMAKPFDFAVRDSITLDRDEKFVPAKNDNDLEKKWERLLKYRVLSGIYNFSSDSTEHFLLDRSPVDEQQVKDKILKKMEQKYKDIPGSDQALFNWVLSVFLNSVATAYDPHTMYFTASQSEQFKRDLSTDAYSFGISLEENKKEEVAIAHLYPGGPAWKSNVLNKGDVIVRIKFPNNNDFDLSMSGIDEAEALLESPHSLEVSLTVRKPDGQLKTVDLVKEKLTVDENKIKSYILKGPESIGYISLPDFYTDMDDMGHGLGCANDMAKEILKLKKENISGLIIDLRYNGGGSLKEAIELAGIFIDEGPICLLKGRDKPPTVLKDLNRGKVYDGPIVVMVNGSSASASELIAAVLQDYHIAVIAGSPTFGKATGQFMMPIDSSVYYGPKNKLVPVTKLAYVKITDEKLYRVTCRSNQRKGVIPDIPLPGVYDDSEFRESSFSNSQPNDSVVKKVYYTPLPPLPLAALSEKSRQRIAGDKNFARVIQLKDSMDVWDKKNSCVALDSLSFKKNQVENIAFMNRVEAAAKRETTCFSVSNTKYDTELFKMDDYRKDMNTECIKKIKSDIYVEECFKIINDLINIGPRK